MILRIAIPTPLRRLFDYLSIPNQALPSVGSRVRVKFGPRTLIGMVIAHSQDSDIPADKLRSIEECLDNSSLLPPENLQFLQWASNYYHFPLGEALAQALPKFLRSGKQLENYQEKLWKLSKQGEEQLKDPKTQKRAPSRFELLQFIAQDNLSESKISSSHIKRSTFRAAVSQGFIEEATEPKTESTNHHPLLKQAQLTLTEEQQQARDHIQLKGFQVSLLEGVTGSGKTEIYLQLVEQALKEGKQALILVPEIGLTPQTVKRFDRRFHTEIAQLHSGLADGERARHWLQCSHGQARILIGTRSAIFTPLPNLGIIIIDEEHDSSYKQQDTFRYSARDLAIYLGQQKNIPVILGSATPSMESLQGATEGRYQHLQLQQRPSGAEPPPLEIVDLNQHPNQQGLSQKLQQEITHTLGRGEQVLLFINRRGYAPALRCNHCGWISECSHCSAKLTLHKQARKLQCHHCDLQRPIPQQCENCHSRDLQPLGQGTERQEERLQHLYPETPVYRVDRDSTSRKHAMAELYERVNTGEPCILLGTQMLAKGHHFPKVTLVGILDIDSSLFAGDFRAAERLGQLVTQVHGRAGRGELPGRVLMQTHYPDHPIVKCLQTENYQALCSLLREERYTAAMPPFSSLAAIRASATQATLPGNTLQALRQQLPHQSEVTLFGPWPCLMEKRQGRYRWEILLKSPSRQALHQQLFYAEQFFEQHKVSRDLRWHIDVDPQDMS